MKTAISLPDELYYLVERYAEASGLSKSELYVAAISDFIERMNKRDMKHITERINSVCQGVDTDLDAQLKTASRCMLLDSQW